MHTILLWSYYSFILKVEYRHMSMPHSVACACLFILQNSLPFTESLHFKRLGFPNKRLLIHDNIGREERV